VADSVETTAKDSREGLDGGFLATILREFGIAKDVGREADPVGLLSIVFGAELMNRGILLEGLRMWRRVPKWRAPEIGLARRAAEPDRLANAVAEQFFGAFGRDKEYGVPGFAAGAILGENAARISSFYEDSREFLTRVVGLRHEGRKDVVEDLAVGEEVFLIWEQENPYDPKALRVVTRKGRDLGFIRRPIAHKLVARIKAGEALRAMVAVLLGEQYDVNERVWVRVEAS
jgi:hypothetical protein